MIILKVASKLGILSLCFFSRACALCILTTSIALTAQATHVISPLLVDLPSSSYSSSRNWIASTTAEAAFNGGYWNSGAYGLHWIQADAGTTLTLTELKIKTVQSPAGSTLHQLYVSDDNIGAGYGSLSPVYSRSGPSSSGTVFDILLDSPATGRFFLILASGGPSWTALGDTAGRIDWEQQVLNVSAVPLPPAMIAFTTAMLGIGLLARRRKKAASQE